MQRYTPEFDAILGKGIMRLDPDGEYVKYSDAMAPVYIGRVVYGGEWQAFLESGQELLGMSTVTPPHRGEYGYATFIFGGMTAETKLPSR